MLTLGTEILGVDGLSSSTATLMVKVRPVLRTIGMFILMTTSMEGVLEEKRSEKLARFEDPPLTRRELAYFSGSLMNSTGRCAGGGP